MSERPQLLYCQDILESGMAIQSYVQGLTCDAFVQDRMRYSAVIREFEIIGEAVGKLSATLNMAIRRSPGRISRIFVICWHTNISESIWR